MRLEEIVEELHIEFVVFHDKDSLGHPWGPLAAGGRLS
jgi:hypothetical protein